MDLKKLLQSLGQTEEQADAIIAAMQENGLHVSTQPDTEGQPVQTATEVSQKGMMLEKQLQQLQKELKRTKITSAAIIELNKAGVKDADYVLYKAEQGGKLELMDIDEHGQVTGVQEAVAELKATYASQFEAPAVAAENGGVPTDILTRANIKRLDETVQASEVPQTLEEAIMQKLSANEE